MNSRVNGDGEVALLRIGIGLAEAPCVWLLIDAGLVLVLLQPSFGFGQRPGFVEDDRLQHILDVRSSVFDKKVRLKSFLAAFFD